MGNGRLESRAGRLSVDSGIGTSRSGNDDARLIVDGERGGDVVEVWGVVSSSGTDSFWVDFRGAMMMVSGSSERYKKKKECTIINMLSSPSSHYSQRDALPLGLSAAGKRACT